jgi:enoyl-CoA hydratase/carnithine racemase
MLKRLFFKFGSTAKEKIIQEKIGKVGVIYLNSKADLNALSQSMRHEIVESVNEFEKDPSVRVITLLSKVEKAFCAGANIKEFENKTTKDFTANDIFESLHFTIGNSLNVK